MEKETNHAIASVSNTRTTMTTSTGTQPLKANSKIAERLMNKINVIYRTCAQPNRDIKRPDWMDNSGFRPAWFNKSICYSSIESDLSTDDTIHILFDGEERDLPNHIEADQVNELVCFNGGSDAHSYKFVLEYIKEKFKDNDLIYIVEDDYLHKQGWANALRAGATAELTEYWTLYDHPDKYDLNNITPSSIFKIGDQYWRTAPSTTNTVAFRAKTLFMHWDVHMQFCDLRAGMTWDHAKFLFLKEKYYAKVSYPIPGFSTHCDSRAIAPVINWKSVVYFYE